MGQTHLTIPNAISISRIILLPGLFGLLYYGNKSLFITAYVLLGLTDYFDGLLARKFNQVSKLGQELDSLADLLFYISSAYFVYFLFPQAITDNSNYLLVFFALLVFSLILSTFLFHKPIMMHTYLLRLNAVLVFLTVITSFWLDITYIVRGVALLYITGFSEVILIFLYFGEVDPDTRSVYHLFKNRHSYSA